MRPKTATLSPSLKGSACFSFSRYAIQLRHHNIHDQQMNFFLIQNLYRLLSIICLSLIHIFLLLFRRGALRSLSVAHTLPSSQSYAGYPHTFTCTAPRYAGSLPSHDPFFLCTAADMDIDVYKRQTLMYPTNFSFSRIGR